MIEDRILENVPLAPMTTLGIGGPARYFLVAGSREEVLGGLKFAGERDLDVFIMGGGSNLLIADRGIDGLVIKISIKGVQFDEASAGNVLLKAGAGEDWDNVVATSVGRGLAGIECLSGIPGLVGGTPVQNVGAYGQEVSESIVSVDCLDRRTGDLVQLANRDCGFSYRSSIFNREERDRYVVLGVTYSLVPDGEPRLAYKDLIDHFADRQPTLASLRDAVLEIRRAKSMVIDPADPNSRSAGSFFKNPVVDTGYFDELRSRFSGMPSFAFDGGVKIPAAWLIEHAGFRKGFVMGNAGLSERHTLAIVNRGRASASDVMALKDEIQQRVAQKFGIELVPEPVLAGF